MTASDVQGSLKEALYETLTGILSSHYETRKAAEQRIQALEVTEEFGIHLTEFVVDPNCHLPIRQLASVLLKQYVETHWCSLAEKFRPPELNNAVKERIKELLPLGLRESISKVRTAVAYAISGIAHWDWPENWPGLFDVLVSCLREESECAVHGAMRVLTEFSRDLTDAQLPNVGPVILQEMYRIFQNENYSIRTRGRAIEIFITITTLVAHTGAYEKGFIDQYLQPIIPMFCEKFVECLRVPNGPTSDCGFKTDIIKAINCLVTKLPKYISDLLPQMLPPVWETLCQSAKTYQEITVNADEDVDDKEVDSDGEIINSNSLIIAIFEFVQTIVDRKKFTNLLDNMLPEIIYYLIIFMQITVEQIQQWTTNPNQFVEDDECTFDYNVRISAQELLMVLICHLEDKAVHALCDVVTRHIEATKALQANGDGNNSESWWKLRESSLLALSLSKNIVVEKQQAGVLQFDIIRFLDTVVLGMLNDSGSPPLLLGRCLCCGGRYAKIMPPEVSSRFLEATVNGLQENQPPCIRISAVKAIYWFSETSTGKDPIVNIIRCHMPNIFQGLFNLVSQPSTDVLTLVMETFQILVWQHKEFTASVENKICPLTIAVFVKFHSDPAILDICQDIFKDLTQNPSCIEPLQTRLIPTLTSMMTISPMNKLKDEGSRAVALDVLKVLVQYSPTPLSNTLVETAFPTACHCILNSDDNATLQNGGELIRTYLSVSAQQVITHRDNEGQTGLQYILQIIAQLLNPQSCEFTAAFVGRLVTTLIRNVGDSLGENLDLLLKAVLSKMQSAEKLIVMQSLLMIYAHLINTQFDAVLNFLSTVPGPTGQSALAFVLSEWVSRQHLFLGRYDRKVGTIALCKILEYGVTHGDSRLDEITVKGDMIISGIEDRVRTRSKAESQPYEWTTVPVLVKIFKVIINELSNDIEVVSASQDTDISDDEDDEEEDDEDDEDEEDSPRQMHNDDEGIEDNLEIDCYDGRSDDFLLNRRLKNRDKERSLSLQDLNAYRHDMNTEYLKKRHLQRYKPNYINIPEQQSIMYSMIQEKKRSVLGKYHYVQSKVKRYIKDIKEQNRHSLKKQHVEQQQENTNYNISNSNHKNNDTEKTKPVNIKTIKDYAEKTIKELEEISETYDSNVDKMAYSAMSPQIILNGQDNKNGLELIHEESTQNEIQITSYESTQNERDLANTDSKMQKQNGTIDIKQLKLNYPEKEISHFEDAVQPQLIQNGHQGTPAVHYHLRTLSYEEYMRGSSDSSQKTGLNKNAHVIEQDPIQPETYNNSDLMDISAENDDSCPLRIESIKSIKTMSDEAKTNNEQLIFKKINECSSNTTADSSEVTALKKKLTQKTVKYNNLLDTYQKQLMENLKMKQELDELRKTLAKYEKENKPPEQKVVSIQTDAVTESVHNQPQDESESTQTSQSNNKILGNSVISLSSIEQWSSGAGNLSISMKPPEVAKTLQSDDSIILTDNTPAKKHSLSRAFITSSRILQTLSSITQGKTKPENPLTQNSKKRINVNETMDLHSEDSSQPSSSKKRKIADIITPPNFLQAFIASESATESQSKLNEMSNIDSQFKNACDSINKNINFQASSSNTNASQLGATTSTTENKTNANDDAEDNVKCFIYHENENSKDRSFLILAEEPEKDKIIHEKGRIRECGPFLLGNIEVRMSEINGTINIWGKEISQESTAEIETETSSNAKDKSCHWQKTSHARFNGSNVVCSTSRKSKNPPKFELSSAASNFSCLHSPSFNIAKASCSTDKSHADKSYSPNMFSFENCDLSKHRNEWLRCKRTQPQEKLHSCCIHNTDTSEEKCNCSLHKQKFEDNFNCSKEKCSGQEHQRSFSKNLEPNKHLYENITPEEDHVCRNDTSCHHSLHNSESCQEPHKCNKETCELLINREFNELCNHSPNILSDEEPLISLQCSETPDTRRRRLTGKRVRGILMDLIRGCGDCYNPNVSDNTSKSCMHKKDSYLRCPPEVKISPCASPEPTYSRTGQPAGRCCHAYAQRIESQLEEFRMEMEKMRSRSDAILNMLNMLHSVDTN